jgi:uncharacterized linocin/CFP29 family protein
MDIELVGISSEEAKKIQDLAKTEINKVRRVDNLLSHEKFPVGTHNAKHEVIAADAGGRTRVNDRSVVQFVELDTSIEMEVDQLEDPSMSALHRAIKEAARLYAQGMDDILINGQDNDPAAVSAKSPNKCNLRFGAQNGGLLSGGANPIVQDYSGNVPPAKDLLTGITKAKTALQADGHEPPYCLIMSPLLYTEAVSPSPNLQLPITTIKELINADSASQESSKIVESVALSEYQAILFKPDEIDVAHSYDGKLRVSSIGDQIRLKLFGEFALRIKNPSSISAIHYHQKAADRETAPEK